MFLKGGSLYNRLLLLINKFYCLVDELKKKISENYVIVRSHLQDDLRIRGTLSPLQEACW